MEEIVTFGHPSLNIKSQRIYTFNDNLRTLIEQMTQTMYKASGVGLAAPQISKNIKLNFLVGVVDNSSIVKKDFVLSGKSEIIFKKDLVLCGKSGSCMSPEITETIIILILD